MDLEKSLLYKFCQAEKQEILRHKWLESEKVGYDIGYNKAVLSWVWNHKRDWTIKELESLKATFSGDMLQNEFLI